MRRERGSTALEAALILPLLLVLFMGMVEIAKVTYVYYTIQRTLHAIARQVGTAQGADLCNQDDEAITAAKNFVLTGTSDGSAESFLPALTAGMIHVEIERYDADTQQLGQSDDCSLGPPDFVVVSIPNGYTVQPVIPFLLTDAIPLRPVVRVPYGGT
jgi:hypothetical protein